MANIRQYIGARYVFKIYENSQDPSSAEWEANVTYEPLTIVTYLNSTYASKKDVPGAVGNPAANPQYWIVTGAYNGQIATLQQQIDTINNTDLPNINAAIQALSGRIDQIAANKILFMGDSFNTIYPGEGWDVQMISELGLTSDDYYQINLAGAGFTASPSWYDGLNNRLSLIDDKESYKSIIICSGGNDNTATLSALVTAMDNFKSLVEANFPNADIYVGYIGWTGLPAYHSTFRNGLNNYIEACDAVGFRYLHNVEYVLHWKPYLRDNTSENPYDYLHPTSAGLVALGEKILEAYLTGECHVKYSALITITVNGTDVGSIAPGTGIVASIDNDVCNLIISPQSFAMLSNIAALSGRNIGSFSCDCFDPTQLLVSAMAADTTTGAIIPMTLGFQSGSFIIAPIAAITSGHNVQIQANIYNFLTTSC